MTDVARTSDTLAPPPLHLDAKQFRGVYNRASRLLEPLSVGDRKRVLTALVALLGEGDR
jgi:hypothetical protein